MEFSIDTASRTPICRQLASQIREAVARGKLQPEQRLPSVHELSRSLVVNPNTIARVYTELERKGVLNTRPGLGVFVASPRADLTRKVRQQRLREAMGKFLTEAVGSTDSTSKAHAVPTLFGTSYTTVACMGVRTWWVMTYPRST